MRLRAGIAGILLLATACGEEVTDQTDDQTSGEGESSTDGDPGEVEELGRCAYLSPFTQAPECRVYSGEDWTSDSVDEDCTQLGGEVVEMCASEDVLGRCLLESGPGAYEVVAYGTDASSCSGQKFGCETFGGGTWVPEGICQDDQPDPDPEPQGSVFIPPTLECVAPLPGEEAGNGPDGQVCTWQFISGSTEEGRRFSDYASCEVVLSQRPYYPVPAAEQPDTSDPRMDDPEYTGELAWVREQIEASACICCHSDEAPNGASNWTIDAPGNWMWSFRDAGLAMAAGWIDSTSFGAYPPEENNGFDRTTIGVPSTDPERMAAFFAAELNYRGRVPEDFADDAPFGGPLYTQLIYEPEACSQGEGVAADGTIVWEGGPARYVYVLEADSANPTVPPNLDLPEGTMWRIDMPWDMPAIDSGNVRYGELPSPMSQRFPEAGSPVELTPGTTYYLYVLRDVAIPITRCLFTYK